MSQLFPSRSQQVPTECMPIEEAMSRVGLAIEAGSLVVASRREDIDQFTMTIGEVHEPGPHPVQFVRYSRYSPSRATLYDLTLVGTSTDEEHWPSLSQGWSPVHDSELLIRPGRDRLLFKDEKGVRYVSGIVRKAYLGGSLAVAMTWRSQLKDTIEPLLAHRQQAARTVARALRPRWARQ